MVGMLLEPGFNPDTGGGLTVSSRESRLRLMFGIQGIASLLNLGTIGHGATALRADNSITYLSPSHGGWYVSATAALGEAAPKGLLECREPVGRARRHRT